MNSSDFSCQLSVNTTFAFEPVTFHTPAATPIPNAASLGKPSQVLRNANSTQKVPAKATAAKITITESLLKTIFIGEWNEKSKKEADHSGSKGRHGPTHRFLSSMDERDERMTESYKQILPYKAIIQREEQHLDTHVPLYTAFTQDVFLCQVVSSAVVKIFCGDQDHPLSNVTWLRSPLDSGPRGLVRHHNVQQYLTSLTQQFDSTKSEEQMAFILKDDHSPVSQWSLISCNPHLYGNIDTSDECTLEYYYDNKSVSPPKAKDFMATLFNQAGFNFNPTTLREVQGKIVAEKEAFFAHSERGVLHQIFVPLAEVNRSVVITQAAAVLDAKHPNALKALRGLQQPDAKTTPNYRSMQARLYVPSFLEANQEKGYLVYTYGGMEGSEDAPPRDMSGLVNTVQRIISQAIQRPQA